MEVVNEVDRFFLSSQSCRVNALLRDVGFTPVACDACNGQITSGFFVVVMGCRTRRSRNRTRKWRPKILRQKRAPMPVHATEDARRSFVRAATALRL
eukprot:TRINITY_DN16750_c1_g1_i2.p1 TRINITY_DN16750_c1_g1~~TRINITY_DN16750_c1_g1_i2.p1  ORF type:complete len:108 (-),score=10.40 TRINITY_DN16750_c1_g1_i2:99-389(-)